MSRGTGPSICWRNLCIVTCISSTVCCNFAPTSKTCRESAVAANVALAWASERLVATILVAVSSNAERLSSTIALAVANRLLALFSTSVKARRLSLLSSAFRLSMVCSTLALSTSARSCILLKKVSPATMVDPGGRTAASSLPPKSSMDFRPVSPSEAMRALVSVRMAFAASRRSIEISTTTVAR